MRDKRLPALLLIGVLLAVTVVSVILFSKTKPAQPSPQSTNEQGTTVTQTPGFWEVLLQSTPAAYFTPLPESVPTVLDGLYTKVDQSWPQWWKCLRCADYRVAGGIWKLQLDKGVMRIFYEVNNWRSIASYTVSGDRLFVFNDPYCPEHTGEYQWAIVNGELQLTTVSDPCSFDLRAGNLSKQPWVSCAQQASAPGCTETQPPAPAAVEPEPPLHVEVYGGDSRFFEKPPDVYAHANAADMPPPEGIEISYADDTIPYGLHRVLWWNGEWIEVTFGGSYSSMGVQILGEQAIGWARVLFDGEEVWRGNTSAIWSKYGRHGGFIEVSGFESGEHTLRVESMGFDYRPVTVASFGFSDEGNVLPGNP